MSKKRSFTIHLKQVGTGKTATINATQAEFTPVYIFTTSDQTSFTTGANGETKVITVTSERTTASGGKVAVPMTAKVSGAAEALVSVQVDGAKATITTSASTSYDDETATVTLTQAESGKTITLALTLAGKADDGVFTADPTTLVFEAKGGTKTSTITSTSKGQTVGWEVVDKSSVPYWLQVEGEGSGQLKVTVMPNE